MRARALVEILFAQAISRKLFAQRSSLGETVGILLVVAGVAVLLLAA